MQSIKKHSLILFVIFTNNNILCTLTDLEGKTLKSVSTGSKKIKGIKKVTNTTITTIIKILYKYVKTYKFFSLYVRIKGTSKSKNEFIKTLKTHNFNILLIQEKLSLPHGGCRTPRLRKL